MPSVSRTKRPIHLGLDVHKDSISVAILHPDSEAVDVEHIQNQKLHQPLSQVVVVFQSPTTPVSDPAYQREVDTLAARARGFRHVTSVRRGDVSADG